MEKTVGSVISIRYRNKLTKKLEEGIIKSVNIEAFIRKSLKESCERIRNYARSHHRFKSRTGRLERAIKYRIARNAMSGTIYVDESTAVNIEHGHKYYYADYVDKGTSPHIIYGRYSPKKVLHFYWERAGKDVYTHMVHHPGNKPYNVEDSIRNAYKSRPIGEIFRKNLERLLNGD